MEDYKDIKNILKPRRDFIASAELHERIQSTLDAHTRKGLLTRWVWGIGATCAAAVIALLVTLPSGLSAQSLLQESVNTLRRADAMEMSVEIRTLPMENFRYININEDFVTHRINVCKADSILSWRIDKGGRTAAGNNSSIYNWLHDLKIGWCTHDNNPEPLLGYLSTLLSPEHILESELEHCVSGKKSDYSLQKNGDRITLTIHAMPDGNFGNPYMLNASIAESENIRRYVIDTQSKKLLSASVSVVNGKLETEVLRISGINYNAHCRNLAVLPSDVRFIDVTADDTLPGLASLSATEAASVILNAFQHWNTEILDSVIYGNILDAAYRDYLKGAMLISVGKSFSSGNGSATFVPYVLKLRDGSVKRHNLVLQKTQQGSWIVAGGL